MVERKALVDTITSVLQGEVRVVVLEGVEGIGRSTILHQFADTHQGNVLRVQVSNASRWALDPQYIAGELCLDLCAQLGEATTEEGNDIERLSSLFLKLHRRVRKTGGIYYVCVDGLDSLGDDPEPAAAILTLLPFGYKALRFVLTGSLDRLPLTPGTRLVSKTFVIPYLSQAEASQLLDNTGLSVEQIAEIYSITRGLPAHLSSVRRLLDNGLPVGRLLESLPSELPGLFKLEWDHLASASDAQLLLLAILAFETPSAPVEVLAKLSGLDVGEATGFLDRLSFVVSDKEGVRFVSDAFRKFATGRLEKFRAIATEVLVENYTADPDSEAALAHLPQLYSKHGNWKQLIDYLSPQRFAQIYQRAPSLSLVQQRADEGIAAARKMSRDSEVFRFTVQRSAIVEFADSDIGVAEVKAMAALGSFEQAMAIGNGVVRSVLRLRLLAAVSRVRKEQRLSDDPDLNDAIRKAFSELSPADCGSNVIDIASDLFLTHPDIATELLGRASETGDPRAMDRAYSELSLQAHIARQDPSGREQAEVLANRIRNPTARRMTREIGIALAHLAAKEVLHEAAQMDSPRDRLYVLRLWATLNRDRDDAETVLDEGLKIALQAMDFTPTAIAYRELASCLPYLSDWQRVSYYLGRLDAQRAVIERIGPSEDYVRLLLLMGRAEWKWDHEAARRRFESVFEYVSDIKDIATRTACAARLVSALHRTDAGLELETIDSLHTLGKQLMTEGVTDILTWSAEQGETCRSTIRALALARADLALDLAGSLNTEPRRDEGYGFLVESAVSLPITEVDWQSVDLAMGKIQDPEEFTDAVRRVSDRLRKEATTQDLPKSALAALRRTLDVPFAAYRCGFASMGIAALRNTNETIDGWRSDAITEFEQVLTTTWTALDDDWNKLDLGFEIVAILAKNCRPLAERFVNDCNGLKRALLYVDEESALTGYTSVCLAVRAYAHLAKAGKQQPYQRDRLMQAIGSLASVVDQALVLGDLGERLYLAGEQDECMEVVQRKLVPLLESIPETDQGKLGYLVVHTAPALYGGARISASTILRRVPTTVRDDAMRAIIRTLLTRVPYSDPVEEDALAAANLSAEILGEIVQLLRGASSDSLVYDTIERVVESVTDERRTERIRSQQRAELVRQLEEVARSAFPSQRFIKHEGYAIATEAILNRLREPGARQGLAGLAGRARLLPNIADQAYVMAVVASQASSAKERERYVNDTKTIIDTIPMLGDRVDRYQTLSRTLARNDASESRECLRRAYTLAAGGVGESFQERRRSLLESAYRQFPDLASALADMSDDDPAKERSSKQLRIYQLADELGGRRALVEVAELKNARDMASAAWRRLAWLNTGRVSPIKAERALEALSFAARLKVSDAYPLYAWYIENCGRLRQGKQALAEAVAPLLEASLLGAELAVRASGRASATTRRALSYVEDTATQKSTLIDIGQYDDAVVAIQDWIASANPSRLWIVEPYFPPSDIGILAVIREAAPDCSVVILTSRSNSLDGVLGDPEDVYRRAWERIRDDDPPATQVILLGTSQSGRFPIHDRWWFSDGSGLHIGTSVGGLGKKVSALDRLEGDIASSTRTSLDRYFTQSAREFNGERLRYSSFTL